MHICVLLLAVLGGDCWARILSACPCEFPTGDNGDNGGRIFEGVSTCMTMVKCCGEVMASHRIVLLHRSYSQQPH